MKNLDLDRLFIYKNSIMIFSRIKDGFVTYGGELITMWGKPKKGLELTREMTVESLYHSLDSFGWI